MPTDGQPILILHDTAEFSHQRKDSTPIGILDISGGHKDGRKRLHTVYGISMHSSLAVTLEGVPLGLTAIKCWTRDNFKAANAPKKINPTRVPIEKKESIRWLENLRQSCVPQARCRHQFSAAQRLTLH